jgi:hypothetical protein
MLLTRELAVASGHTSGVCACLLSYIYKILFSSTRKFLLIITPEHRSFVNFGPSPAGECISGSLRLSQSLLHSADQMVLVQEIGCLFVYRQSGKAEYGV